MKLDASIVNYLWHIADKCSLPVLDQWQKMWRFEKELVQHQRICHTTQNNTQTLKWYSQCKADQQVQFTDLSIYNHAAVITQNISNRKKWKCMNLKSYKQQGHVNFSHSLYFSIKYNGLSLMVSFHFCSIPLPDNFFPVSLSRQLGLRVEERLRKKSRNDLERNNSCI